MIDALEPYPEYKDSGVEWLGRVPAHWDVEPLGRLGRIFKGNGGSKDDEVSNGVPCVRYGDLYTRHDYFIRRTKACIPAERAGDYTPIRYGDVLFAASGETIDEIGKSAINLLRKEARCGGDLLVLRPTVEADPEFLGYACDSPAAKAQKAGMGRGFTVVHIYGSQLKRLLLPLPPLPEQAAIVRFLDYVDRRVRRVIRARKRLVELLGEYKQALVHQAVTGRIDVRTGQPYPEYKDSGVEWLGQVPAHWEVRKVRYVAKVINGYPFDSARFSQSKGIPLIRIRDLNKTTTSVYYDGPVVESAIVNPGDVLIGMDGEFNVGAWKGSETALLNQRMCCIRSRIEKTDKFLMYLLPMPLRHINDITWSTTVKHLSSRQVERIQFALPPLLEQGAIVEYLDAQTARIDRAVDAARREIDLLEAFRTRLIADVVTGKLDVRGVKCEDGSVKEGEVESMETHR